MIVGIVGAGNMGTGIAKAFAMNDGFTVYLCDSNELIANKASFRFKTGEIEAIRDALAEDVTKENMKEAPEAVKTGGEQKGGRR